MYVTMLALLVGAVVNLSTCYLLVYALELGFDSAPLSYAAAAISLPLFTWCARAAAGAGG